MNVWILLLSINMPQVQTTFKPLAQSFINSLAAVNTLHTMKSSRLWWKIPTAPIVEPIYLLLHRSGRGRVLIRVLKPKNSFIPLTVQIHKSNEPFVQDVSGREVGAFQKGPNSIMSKYLRADNVFCHTFGATYNNFIFDLVARFNP